jgi:DNA polymerase III subunit epsilon
MTEQDNQQAILWARAILSNPTKYYILDTETTGLHNPEIVELAIIDIEGNMIINQRFCPTCGVEPGASAIHGLTNATLAKCPNWHVVADKLEDILLERKLLIYNFDYDRGAITNTYRNHNLRPPLIDGDCVMHWYSQFVGDFNDYRRVYRWQKLPGGDHSAIGDCIATLEVIKRMASTPLDGEPPFPNQPRQTLTDLPHSPEPTLMRSIE